MATAESLPAQRLDDIPAEGVDPGALDVSALVGTWLNTDHGDSGEVAKLLVEPSEEKDVLLVRGFAAAGGDASDWGEVRAPVFAFGAEGGTAWGFTCEFERGDLTTEIAAYGKEGILIIVTYNGGDAGHWTREFFHREGL